MWNEAFNVGIQFNQDIKVKPGCNTKIETEVFIEFLVYIRQLINH